MNKGGAALKQAIHIARAKAGITSDMQLSLAAGVHYDTLMNWYGDRTVPRGAELKKVAEALGTPFADLMAAYEGRGEEPPELTTVLRELTEKVNDLVDQLRQDDVEVEARLRAAEAELRQLRAQRGAPESDARSVPHETTE